MSKAMLQIKDLHVTVEGKEILRGLSLDIEPGKIYAMMGPNGSGKSTLSYTIAGHSKYVVSKGSIKFEGKDLTKLGADIRAQRGIFLSFQYPKSIPGVSMFNFLRTAYKAVKQKNIRVFNFQKILKEKMKELNMPESFLERYVNDGFSGGEKKKTEILQALLLEPKLIIMDETDSGLDVDSLKEVAEGVSKLVSPKTSILLITHHCRILHYLQPDEVHVMKQGKIVASGGEELAQEIEKNGFASYGESRGLNILD